MSRRNGRNGPSFRCVMSRPSKVIFPAVGSRRRVNRRAVVLLPHPDSPTIENVSPTLDCEVHSVHRLNAPTCRRRISADRKVLDQPVDNDQVGVRLGVPAAAGFCAGAVTASAQSLVPRSPRGRSGTDGRPQCGRVRREPVPGRTSSLRPFVSAGVFAARVKWAAGRHLDQAGRRALDREQPLTLVRSKRGIDPSRPQV